MKKKGMSVRFLTQGAVIAAIYVALVMIFNYCSFGPVQFRIAEALTILPYFTPAAIPGLFIGCIIANILGGAILWDVVFGSIATLIGAIGTYLLRKSIICRIHQCQYFNSQRLVIHNNVAQFFHTSGWFFHYI